MTHHFVHRIVIIYDLWPSYDENEKVGSLPSRTKKHDLYEVLVMDVYDQSFGLNMCASSGIWHDWADVDVGHHRGPYVA